MTNDQALELLNAQLAGELTPTQSEALQAWINADPDHRVLADAFQLQDAQLRKSFEPRREASAITAERVAAHLPSAALPEPAARKGRRGFLTAIFPPAVAAGLLLVVWIGVEMTSPPPTRIREEAVKNTRSGGEGLKAKPKAPAPKTVALAVNATASTKVGERQRVALPDGSIVYLNEKTSIQVTSEHQIQLSSGQVFIEAAPANEQRGPFSVQTPDKTLTALGTKFEVSAEPKGTGVLVAQGKVEVSGLASPIAAGEELAAGAHEISIAPRASYALDWTQDLMIAADSPLVPAGQFDGGALVAVDPQGQEAKLSLVRCHIDVHIEDGFSCTTIDQTYFNHENVSMEGTFYFALPPDASLSRLAMYVSHGEQSTLMEGGMAERNLARQTYEKIRYARRDPALLEWVDGSLFKMRVFPLESRQEKRIILSYSQKLRVSYGRTQYRFPAGHTLNQVRDWSVHVLVKNGATLTATSPSHPDLKKQVLGADLVLDDQKANARVDRDLVLQLDEANPNPVPPIRWSLSEQDGHRYLMLRYRPQLPAVARRERRDWVILFEASGARDPLVARTQIEILRNLLRNAETDDTFALMTVGTRVQTFAPQPLPVNDVNLAAAVQFLEQTQLIGALNLEGALQQAQTWLRSGQNPHLVHLGGGVVTLGEHRPEKLLALVPPGTRYVSIGVGKRVSPAFMKVAAEKTGGLFTQINPDESIAWRSFELASTLNTSRLLNITVTAPGDKMPRFLTFTNALAHGEELTAVARVDGALFDHVAVQGSLDGQVFGQAVAVNNFAPQADYLPRTWAKLEIDRLLAEDGKDHRQTVIDLSKAMYVMTPYTSLLVLENEAMYREFKIDRDRKDHWALYRCPAQMPTVHIPDPNRPAQQDAQRRPSEKAVLQTIWCQRTPSYLASASGRQQSERDEAPPLSHIPLLGRASERPFLNLRDNVDKTWSIGLEKNAPLRFRDASKPNPLVTFNDWGVSGVPSNENRGNDGSVSPNLISRPRPSNWLPTSYNGRGNEQFNFETNDWTMSTGRNPDLPIGPSRTTDQGIYAAAEFIFFHKNHPVIDGLPSSNVNGTLGFVDSKIATSEEFAGLPDPDLPEPTEPAIAPDQSLDQPSVRKAWRILEGTDSAPQYYMRPSFTGTDRVFSHLLAYAPGMNSSPADVQAVLEAEAAPRAGDRRGEITLAARVLIDGARTANWQVTQFGKDDRFSIAHDGQGRFTYERILPLGLKEQVICDGTTLWHLYPELGIGARRVVSRFHRAELASLVPDFVPPTEDWSVGADVMAVGADRVAIVPLETVPAGTEDGPRAWLEVHCIFAGNRLTQRCMVLLTDKKAAELMAGHSKKDVQKPVEAIPRSPRAKKYEATATLLVREVYGADGSVQTVDAEGKELGLISRQRKPSQAAEVSPNVNELVVLPLPLRRRAFVYPKYQLNPSENLNIDSNRCVLAQLSPEAQLEVLSADVAENRAYEVQENWSKNFYDRGDRRQGFYTLLSAAGQNMQSVTGLTEQASENPHDPLLRYLFLQGGSAFQYLQKRVGILPGADAPHDFVTNLLIFRALTLRWGDANGKKDLTIRQPERQGALAFALRHADNVWGWSILAMLSDHTHGKAFRRQLAEAWGMVAKKSGFSYYARYEQARQSWLAGDVELAQSGFKKLFTETLEKGILPPIDSAFRECLELQGARDWLNLLEVQAARAIEKKHRPLAVMLAWQARQLGDCALADRLVQLALNEMKPDEQALTTLMVVDYFWQINEMERADVLLRSLLENPKLAQSSVLWRLAAKVANARGQTIQHFADFEKALDLEFLTLPETVNLQAIRHDYRELLKHYQWLADASRSLKIPAPADLASKTVRYADQWRGLDPDVDEVCGQAAKILRTLGASELAWDYLTTPLAMKPNDSKPWLTLAKEAKRAGDLALADRSYQEAYCAEPTNAQILWDRSQLLQRRGREAEAREIMMQIVQGDWQERFNGLKMQARQILGAQNVIGRD